VGGSFFWPPKLARSAEKKIKRAVFVAGGVGINPLMSMVSTLEHVKKESGELGFSVKFLYTTRDPGSSRSPTEILFLERLQSVFRTLGTEGELHLFLTPSKNTAGGSSAEGVGLDDKSLSVQRRRITQKDLIDALGPVEERPETLCYICGVPGMTDEFVEKATRAEGMDEENVLFEKWW
jgi:ferredoxin-NADP reductase